jgi:hypothetical protein
LLTIEVECKETALIPTEQATTLEPTLRNHDGRYKGKALSTLIFASGSERSDKRTEKKHRAISLIRRETFITAKKHLWVGKILQDSEPI